MNPVSAAWGQVGDGAVWLGPDPLELTQDDSDELLLVNLVDKAISVQIEVVGSGTGVTADPAQLTIPASGEASVTVTSSGEVGTANLVAWGNGTFSTKQVVVAATDVADTLPLPDALPLRGRSYPVSDGESSIIGTLPDDLGQQSGSACIGDEGVLVGRMSGPDGEVANVCLDGRTLSVVGADEPGTWSGSVDVLPDDAEAGSIKLTVSVRDFWPLPLATLLAGLAIALFIPLSSVLRARLLLRYHTEGALDRVRVSQEATRDAIRKLSWDQNTDVDVVCENADPLYLDREAAALLAGMSNAIDATARAQWTPPDGAKYAAFEALASAAVLHDERLLSIARSAARLGEEIKARFPDLDVRTGHLLVASLSRERVRIVSKPDWDRAVALAVALDADVALFVQLWERIKKLAVGEPSMEGVLKGLAEDLLESADNTALKAVRDSIAELETGEAPEDEAVQAVPVRERFVVSLVSAVLLFRQLRQTGLSTEVGTPVTLRAAATMGTVVIALLAAVIVSGFIGLIYVVVSVGGPWVWSLGVLPLAIAVFVFRRRVARVRGVAWLRREIARLDRVIAVVGGLIVASTGFVTLYLQDGTFGGFADYFTIATWGFTLGSGVNVAKRLLPLKSIEAV